jgi:NTE family protein
MHLHTSRIGLALSGGGIRAAVFHLGVLQYLAEAGVWGQIANISSVSGASLAMGIILAAAGNRWPNESEFLQNIQPTIRTRILQNNIQAAALRRLPFSPKYWRHRVHLLAKMLEEKWDIRGNIQDLPAYPYWEINCTTFETGNNFRIRRDYMGDSAIGYVQNPRLPISHMIAASAAFPVLIGPYILETADLRWTKDKHGKGPPVSVSHHYTLWDGGVYDNLGIAPLYTTGRGLDKEIDFLVVSNASAFAGHQRRRGNISIANLRRLLDISMNQVDVLRSRQVLASVVGSGRGVYIKIGDMWGHYTTTLNAPTPQDYDQLLRHGYKNAKHMFLT